MLKYDVLSIFLIKTYKNTNQYIISSCCYPKLRKKLYTLYSFTFFYLEFKQFLSLSFGKWPAGCALWAWQAATINSIAIACNIKPTVKIFFKVHENINSFELIINLQSSYLFGSSNSFFRLCSECQPI